MSLVGTSAVYGCSLVPHLRIETVQDILWAFGRDQDNGWINEELD